MRYLICKGGQVSYNLLPARLTLREAKQEIIRLETNRAEQNQRAYEYKPNGLIGSCFMAPRYDGEIWSIREID